MLEREFPIDAFVRLLNGRNVCVLVAGQLVGVKHASFLGSVVNLGQKDRQTAVLRHMVETRFPGLDFAARSLGCEQEEDATLLVAFDKLLDLIDLTLPLGGTVNRDAAKPQDDRANDRNSAPAVFD